MPQSRGGEWEYAKGERRRDDVTDKAENRAGHRALNAFTLPTWVQHPDIENGRKFIIEKSQFVGMAVEGSRNYENWSVAHVAAFHDDLKLLSLATPEQLVQPNRWGMTPAHMCSMGVHEYGAALHVLYELIQEGAVDPKLQDFQGLTPWHLCQRMHSPEHLKAYEKVMYKSEKPQMYEERKEAQLRKRGKFRSPTTMANVANSEVPPSCANVANGDAAPPLGVAPTLPVCIVFPGQGSQYVGMLKGLQALPAVKAMLETAKKVLGYDILELCLKGPEDKLALTKYCQPAMFIAGLAALEQLKIDQPEKVSSCQALAGLSLGEYAALAAAGVFDFETGLQLVKARAEAMEHETTKPDAPPQAMLSVVGVEESTVNRLCKECAGSGQVCQIANYLFPKGFAIAGHKDAIEKLHPKMMEAGALQAKLLKTGGGFHTSMMQGARSALLSKLEDVKVRMQPPRCQVFMNVTSKAIGPSTDVSEIVALLGDQLVSPVRWDASMHAAINAGCKEFFECGPNKQLKSMMKRIHLPTHAAMLSVQA